MEDRNIRGLRRGSFGRVSDENRRREPRRRDERSFPAEDRFRSRMQIRARREVRRENERAMAWVREEREVRARMQGSAWLLAMREELVGHWGAVLRNFGEETSPTRGLTAERIARFQRFHADQSMVGERCVVCMSDLEVGTRMVRLDCHVDHCLCKACADGWFRDHNTCPKCRRVFN